MREPDRADPSPLAQRALILSALAVTVGSIIKRNADHKLLLHRSHFIYRLVHIDQAIIRAKYKIRFDTHRNEFSSVRFS